jgi:cell division protease FtsH
MNRAIRAIIFWLVIAGSAFVLWQTVKSPGSARAISEISYSEFLARVAGGQVNKVTIAGSVVQGSDAKGGTFRVIAPANQTAMLDALQERGVDIWFKENPEQGWPNWILNLAPLILLGALWFFMIRQMQRRCSGGEGSVSYTPSQDGKPRFGS